MIFCADGEKRDQISMHSLFPHNRQHTKKHRHPNMHSKLHNILRSFGGQITQKRYIIMRISENIGFRQE